MVAIDFGTTYSGYALQFRHEYDPKDPTKIRAPQTWNGGKQVWCFMHRLHMCLFYCFRFDLNSNFVQMASLLTITMRA